MNSKRISLSILAAVLTLAGTVQAAPTAMPPALRGLLPGELQITEEQTIDLPAEHSYRSRIAIDPTGTKLALLDIDSSSSSRESKLYIVNLLTNEFTYVDAFPQAEWLAWDGAGARLAVKAFDAAWTYTLSSKVKKELPKDLILTSGYSPVAWNPVDNRITFGGWGTIRFLNGKNQTEDLQADVHLPSGLAWTGDGKRLAIAHGDLSVLQNNKLYHTPPDVCQYSCDFRDVAWAPDASMLAAVEALYENTEVRLISWSDNGLSKAEKGKTVQTLKTPERVNAIAWSPDGSRLYGVGGEQIHVFKLTEAPGTRFVINIDPRIKPTAGAHFDVSAKVAETSAITDEVLSYHQEPAGFARIKSVGANGSAEVIYTQQPESPTAAQQDIQASLLDFLERDYVKNAIDTIKNLPANAVTPVQVSQARSLVDTYVSVWTNGRFKQQIQELADQEVLWQETVLKVASTSSAAEKRDLLTQYIMKNNLVTPHYTEANAQIDQLTAAARQEAALQAYTSVKATLAAQPVPEQIKRLSDLIARYPDAAFVAEAQGLVANLRSQLEPTILRPDVPPLVYNGTTLVPLRALAEWVGAEVSYDAPSQTVKAVGQGHKLILRVGDRTAFVDDTAKTLALPAVVLNGRTFIPLRFFSESLGVKVTWEAATSSVLLELPDKRARVSVPVAEQSIMDELEAALRP